MRSARFIYAHEDFSQAIAPLLDRHPELREIKTHVHVGRMGEGPLASMQMPEGQWLVLFGTNNHYMIRASEWDDDSFPLEVSIDDIEMMNRALADCPLREMRIYENRIPRRIMRDVQIEIVSAQRPARIRIRIRHADPGLDALSKAIERHRRGMP